MAINFKKYIKIVSGVGGAAAASRRDLGLRVFTTNQILTYNQILTCTSADDVMAIFGDKSDEYAIAANYFGYISNSITQANQISFTRWINGSNSIYMTRLTAAKEPLGIENFTKTIGLKLKLGNGGGVNEVLVSVEIGEGEVAADYAEVANLFTKALTVKSNTYSWLKGAACEYSGGVFFLEFTNNSSGASAGPSVSLTAFGASDDDSVTDARKMMGLRNFNVWDAAGWSRYDKGSVPDWTATTLYHVGDYAKNSGSYYCCKDLHTSGATFVATNWVKIADWAAGTSYSVGDYVISGGEVYKCKTAHESESTFNEAKFDECAWSDSAAYSVGAYVKYDGSVYCCISAVEAPSGSNPITKTDIVIGAETPVKAVSRINGIEDNFGSFMFKEEISDGDKKKVAQWNKGQNYKYLYWTYALIDTYAGTAADLYGYECTAVTFENRHNEFAEFMPAALFAATDYTRVNSTKTFMYKQFSGINPSVGLKGDPSPAGNYANLYQDLDAKRINYYGQTMKSGKPLCFYQDGNCMDGTEISVACNEVWMKDAIETEIINLLIAMEKVPASNNGIEMINMMINGVISEALNNGAINPGKTLTNVQKVYIDTTAGEKEAWKAVYTNGYWLNTVLKQDNSTGTTVYKADYTLIYSKGDAIRKVTGSDILV